ncbi:MAG: protein translocase subunit SecF [Candidatus Hydrogenedentota bacterium]|nr:MAG: protein translocase subunit SecF [Candidatus Hydrogenedentota bacterium]
MTVQKKTFPFISWRRKAYAFSAALFVIFGIGTLVRGGLNYGIDFVGGTSVIVKFAEPVTTERLAEIREALLPAGLGSNIRTIGKLGGSKEEAREISVDVRGTVWIDSMVRTFLRVRDAKGEKFSVEDIRGAFAGLLEKESLSQLLAPFLEQNGKPPLYDFRTVKREELEEVFQRLFNENVSALLDAKLSRAFPPSGTPKDFDLNKVPTPQALAERLATYRVENLARKISERIEEKGERSWKTISEFLQDFSLQRYDNPELQRAFTADTETHGTVASILVSPPEDLARAFLPFFTKDFLTRAEILLDHRNHDFGGLFPSVEKAAEYVSTEEDGGLMKRLLLEHAHVGTFIVASAETVGPKIGAHLKKSAFKAGLISLLLIVLYVSFRFQLRYGVGAIVALAHDAILSTLFIGILGLEFSIPIVAAILTVIGYSINDTIVVYDRIREKLGKVREDPRPEIIDLAITETLSRTLATSLTTLAAVLAFLFFGPVVIRDLSLTLAFGIGIGTYSSIFVAAPLLVEWSAARRWWKERKTDGLRTAPGPAGMKSIVKRRGAVAPAPAAVTASDALPGGPKAAGPSSVPETRERPSGRRRRKRPKSSKKKRRGY